MMQKEDNQLMIIFLFVIDILLLKIYNYCKLKFRKEIEMPQQQFKITQILTVKNSNLEVSFYQLAVTRLVNQKVITVHNGQALFNNIPLQVGDYILINHDKVTTLPEQSFNVLFGNSELTISGSSNHDLDELEKKNKELQDNNARQVVTINRLQKLLNDFKAKNDDLRKRFENINSVQERLIIEKDKLKRENARLNKVIDRMKLNAVETITADKKPVKSVVAKKAVSKSTVKKSIKTDKKAANKAVADNKRFKQLRSMNKEQLNETLNLDNIPLKERFDKSPDLYILAMNASSKAELSRWLHRGKSTIYDWVKATNNKDIKKHFEETKKK